MNIRRLTNRGLELFDEYLAKCRAGQTDPTPTGYLTSGECTDPLSQTINIEKPGFNNRFTAAKYLYEILSPHKNALQDLERDIGLWAWLSLYYFDEVCPAKSNGTRTPGVAARHIPDVKNHQRYYRHLLLGPYIIYSSHAQNADAAMCLLVQRLDQPGEVVEQIASRLPLVRNSSILQTLSNLYLNPQNNTLKKRAGSKDKGGARRFAAYADQLDVTWDLFGVTHDKLQELLPKEFDYFRKTKKA